MNISRIYQGRVTALEVENEAGEFETVPENRLQNHAELFNHAVNYHALCLLSLATRPDSEFFKLREQIAEVWGDFSRQGEKRHGMKHSIAKTLGISADEIPTVGAALKLVRPQFKNVENPDHLRQAVLDELLEFCRGDSGIRNQGNEMLPRLCDPDFTGGFPFDAAAWRRKLGEFQLKTTLHELSEADLPGFAEQVELSWVVNLSGATFEGEAAKKRLSEAFAHFRAVPDLPKEPAKLQDLVATAEVQAFFAAEAEESHLASLPDDLVIPRNNKGALSRIFACLLFQHFPNSVTRSLLAIQFPQPKKPKTAGDDWKRDPPANTTPAGFEDDPIKLARAASELGVVYRGFTSLPSWQGASLASAKWQWKTFDVAAAKEALTVFNQIRLKEDERKLDRERLRAEAERLLTGTAASSDDEAEDDREPDAGLQANELFRPFQDLVEDVSRKNAPDSRVDLPREHLSGYAVRGFRDVFALWNAIVDDESPKPDAEVEPILKNSLQQWRKEHLDRLGWAELIQELAKPKWWPVWRHTKSGDETKQNRFISNYVKWCGAKAKAKQLESPVQFTPADPVHSRRLPRFTDTCNFTPKGKFHHNPGEMSVLVPIAVKTGEHWEQRRAKITYAAPRMLRDGLRHLESGEKLDHQAWASPLWQGLLGEDWAQEVEPALQDFSKCAVQLMPRRGPKNPDAEGFLLNFPISLDTTKLRQRLTDELGWQPFAWEKKELVENGTKRMGALVGREFFYLGWSGFDKKESTWWKTHQRFGALSIDFGQRVAAAMALHSVQRGKPAPGSISRELGVDPDGNPWFDTFSGSKHLRLPGEGVGPHAQQDRKGRWATWREVSSAIEIAQWLQLDEQDFQTVDRGSPHPRKTPQASQPDATGCGDPSSTSSASPFRLAQVAEKLVWKFGRAKSHLNSLTRILSMESDSEKHTVTDLYREIDALRPKKNRETEAQLNSVWQRNVFQLVQLFEVVDPDAETIEATLTEPKRADLRRQLIELQAYHARQLPRALEGIAQIVLPQKRRRWKWADVANFEGEFGSQHLIREQIPKAELQHRTNQTTPSIYGQRGLSFERLELLERLRKHCQGLNASLRRFREFEKTGKLEGMAKPGEYRDSLPDACPEIREKINRLRQERVHQTAHLILTEALGLRLKKAEKGARKDRADYLHGEYERIPGREPVQFIVVENLSRYRATQGRSRRENRGLIQWSHRAVLAKLKELAEPFGLLVLEAPAAYSSLFSARDGRIGFRCDEVSELKNPEKAPKKYRAHHELLAKWLKKVNPKDSSGPPRTLIRPKLGGDLFLAATGDPKPFAADINAAFNIGLRALAKPDRFDIHHRVRCEVKSGELLTNETRGRFGEAKNQAFSLTDEAKGGLRSGAKPAFFPLVERLPEDAEVDVVSLSFVPPDAATATKISLAPSGKLHRGGLRAWVAANEWRRCWEVNRVRLKKWLSPEEFAEFEAELAACEGDSVAEES